MGQVKNAIWKSKYSNNVLDIWGHGQKDLVHSIIEMEYDKKVLQNRKEARKMKQRAMAAQRRMAKVQRVKRVGFIYLHTGDNIKIGFAVANYGQRALGQGTATYWPLGLRYVTVPINLRKCTESEAGIRMKCYETLIRAIFHMHLICKSSEAKHPFLMLCMHTHVMTQCWGAGDGCL